MRPYFGYGSRMDGARGIRGEKVVCGAASAPELLGSGQGAAADSLGKDALKCLNNHIHYLRVGHGNTDKDKDSSIKHLHTILHTGTSSWA